MDLGKPNKEDTMDEYDKKFAEMQKYIPFLEAMIERLQKVKDKSREAQLQKMQSLHGILSNSKRKLKIETLQRCEDVLQKLHNKVEKGNTAALNPSHKKAGENSSQKTSSKETQSAESSVKPQTESMDNETPASPSPTASPDHTSKSTPIIIPMERRDDGNASKCDSKPASPDQCEHIPVTPPIIIPTERKDESRNDQSSTNHNSNNCGSDSNDLFEWDLLEESENQINKSRRSTWQSVIAPGTDVATAAKLVCNNLPQKVIPEGRPHIPMAPRHIPTVPAPSMGGLRRIMLAIDKTRPGGGNASSVHAESKPQSPLNVPEVRLKSPDPDMLFSRHKITSPRQKEGVNIPKLSPKPSTPLLVSPPSVLTEPPLSIEDLAELLSDENDSTKKERQNKDSTLREEQSQTTKEVGGEDIGRSKKEILPGKNQHKSHKDSNDPRVPTSFLLTQEDIDRESERRWEERDKHIVKLTASRWCPNKHPITPLSVRLESSRAGDTKVAPSPPRVSQPLLSPGLLSAEKPVDHRNRPPSPMLNQMKEKENEKEHRYADNYERHPRQSRDSHDSGDDAKDKNTLSNNISRIPDDQTGNIGYPIPGAKLDDSNRNIPLYQRRGLLNQTAEPVPPLSRIDEYRRDNVDYFARQTGTKAKRPPSHPPSVVPDFPNPQWGTSAPSYSGNIRPPPPPAPNNYQRNPNNSNFHPDNWQMGQGCPPAVGEFHPMNEPVNQFNPPIRPLINSVSRPQDGNRGMNPESGFREEAAGPTPVIQPLISPPCFPAGTQYRNPRMENRSYDSSFDRSSDISQTRHTWDSTSTRVSDVGYRRENECGRGRSSTDGPTCRPGTPAPGFSRPGTPAPMWNRERVDKDWNRRGRGRERYYNDRGRSESRGSFNRDSRRSEWERDGPNERDNRPRLNRDNRVSERDPRVRPDQQSQSPAQPKETVTASTVRDPRLIKDTANVVSKPKDIAGPPIDRDPRRRSCEAKGIRKTSPTATQPKAKDKTKAQKSIDHKNRRDSEADGTSDKMSKDKLHSPLQSLYGVIDTKAKTGPGYGLQKFKIPKIKRPDPPPPPPPPPPPKTETLFPEVKVPETNSFISEKVLETSRPSVGNDTNESDRDKGKIVEEAGEIDDTTCILSSNIPKSEQLNDVVQAEAENKISTVQKVETAESVQEVSTTTEALSKESVGDLPAEPDSSKPKGEVTKEWIEELIRKSFEFGEGKQLFDQAKLLHQLGEALHGKKLKKIKKIIESDSESSSSSKDEEIIGPKKTQVKKKRRIIFSDSSEEESLADRLGLLKDSGDEQNVSNEILKENVTKNTPSTTTSETHNEAENTPDATVKIDSENVLENPDDDEVAHDTSTAVEEVPVPVARKKRAYKKRGRGSKKVEASAEDPVDSKPAEASASKDETKADQGQEIEKKAPVKVKNKRRNSLEMLQEDIREMFISEGVVTATGHRMCRLIKEGHSNLNSTVPNLPNSQGQDSEKNSRKHEHIKNRLLDSDTDDTNSADQSQKDDSPLVRKGRARGYKVAKAEDAQAQSSKTQKRTSKRTSRVTSKQYIDSSESEEDEPLIHALPRSESMKSLSGSEATTVIEQSEIQQKSEISPKSDESQAIMLLRRSKRVPRVVVEKTEVSKQDSSKNMFDSSSDESFGIDVSELAAAVDISLHPEPQSQPDPDTPESPKASGRQTRTRKQNQTSKKNKSVKIIEDDTMSFTDDGSMLSDISMSSSITSLKKITKNTLSRNSIKSQQDTNEEFLSNMLIGLTAKSTPKKSNDDIDKESDLDADEELEDNLCETSEGTKKSFTRRKKKKCNWQMGILSKKKKKKKAAAPTSPTTGPASEFEFTDPSENSSKTTMSSTGAVGSNSFDSLTETESSSLPKKNDSAEQKIQSTEQTELDSGAGDSKIVDNVPAKRKYTKRRKVVTPDEQRTDVEPEESENISDIDSSISQIGTFEEMNPSQVERLFEHAWTGQDRYKCLLCPFVGKNIVHHYKVNHPGDEVLISRLVPSDAKSAIQEANYIDMSTKSSSEEHFGYYCRFCLFCTDNLKENARETFYEHCTTHTGEYRFKCVSCSYQSVAKTSLKSHYYKVCRKFADNVSVAIMEDEIPDGQSIHGYICSGCNYVQLKKCNLDKHLVSNHRKNSSAKCIKINMSLDVKAPSAILKSLDDADAKTSKEKEETTAQESDDSDDCAIIENKDVKKLETEDSKQKVEQDVHEIDIKLEDVLEISLNVQEDESKVEKTAEEEPPADETNKKTDSSVEKMIVSQQQEPEVLPVNGNLSVFVCPPEIAMKENEIELERKKKMQEVVEDIGIKVNKNVTNQPLSIIDKLRVKMDTNSRMEDDQNVVEMNKDNALIESVAKSQSNLSENSSQLDKQGNVSTEKQPERSLDVVPSDQGLLQSDINLNSPSDTLEVLSSEDNMDQSSNNPETKPKDPLTTFDDSFQNFGSETETSDTEMLSSFAAYESDSSNDQSESQISQDVNSLLKETTADSTAAGKGLMLGTIQRLAAQLQNAKTGPPGQSADEPQMKSESHADKLIPKAPDVIPLSTVRLLNKQEQFKHEQSEASPPPKNLIRLRRLSGDKLSIPSAPVEMLDEFQLSSTEGSSSDLGAGVLQTDTEEECSFLRIENVVSLAPTGDDAEGESSIISDIRKAVETSPVKPRVSILKKSPIILQKVGGRSLLNQRLRHSLNNIGEPVKIIPLKSLPSTSQAPTKVLANILPKIPAGTSLKKSHHMPAIIKKGVSSSSNSPVQSTGNITTLPSAANFKIIKLTRTATLLKHKESVAQSVAIKLKSTEAYAAMLKLPKLCHLFKCMERECTYTTNSLENFQWHFEEHIKIGIKDKMSRPFGCQNCPYCCVVLDDWSQMEKHLLDRHAHCQYQCSYCFYRAITQSYVELHQGISHPGHVIAVLQGKALRDKVPDDCIDRREIVKPFICEQECGKSFYIPEMFMTHLKLKHGPLLSMYKCHLCPATCLKPEKLVSHYKMHGIYKYQCMYCLNGSDVFWELHNHLSNHHCNLPPFVIERTLMPEVTPDQDVINQLVIKNVDDDFKYTDLLTNIEEIPEENWQLRNSLSQNDCLSSSDNSVNNSRTEKLSTDHDKGGKMSLLKKNLYSQFCNNSHDGSAASETSGAQLTVIQHTKDDEVFSNRISIPDNNEFDEYPLHLNFDILQDRLLSNKPTENHFSDKTSNSHVTLEYPATDNTKNLQTVKDSERSMESVFSNRLFVINDAEDPLKLPETANCGNLFDNGRESSSGLRNIVKNEQSVTPPVSKESPAKKTDNYVDSDIEILEEEVLIVESSKKEETKVSQENDTTTETQNNPMSDNKAEEETTANITQSSPDDLNTTMENSNANAYTAVDFVQPLTLEDIKHTGFTGSNLYKCGSENCGFSCETAELLKSHLMNCVPISSEGKSLSCAHCRKRFVKVGFLLDHLKTHGLKRFGCSLCKLRCVMPHQAMSHMKAKHKLGNSKLVPADPKNPSSDGLFIVQPIRGPAERGRKKRTPTRAADKDTDKCIDVEKLSFNPDEIDNLPRQAIYNREALCAVCPYSTKVRTNMVRHLQLHAKDQTVPESGPVNPVPCLDKKERMFDKMVNLASSSHQNGRMGGKTRETEKEEVDDSALPKFVPEHKRYVCGVAECNYLTVDDTMLRCHLKALHSDEPYFRCPHCPVPQPGQETQNIGIDKMGIHLKMHDSRLYKCSHCNHHHYHRHVVERHLADKHGEKRPYVKVIREPEATETVQTVQDEVEDETPDRDGNHWKCNVCDYKCIYKNEMIAHAATEHDERAQFKCTECPYKTTGKINVEQHFVSRHPNELLIKYDMVYQKIKGAVKKPVESMEPGTSDEPFDTTPLWRRDMPRVRHIRGILLEEEEAAAANESPTKGTKRKSEGGDVSGRPAKSRPGKSNPGDGQKLSDDKTKMTILRTPDAKRGAEPNSPVNERLSKTRAVDKLRLLDKSENDKLNESSEFPVTDTSFSEDFSELSDSDMGQFGPYGKPIGGMYVCTLCSNFETRYKHDLRYHLYRELKYKKWHCRVCGFLSVNRHTLMKHFGKQHPDEDPDYETLTPDNSIEEWVATLLQRQTNIIKGIPNKPSSKISGEKSTPSSPAPGSAQSKKSNTVVQSTTKTMEDNSKIVDLTDAVSLSKDTSINTDMEPDMDDEDSGDNDDLVIDLKDDNMDTSDLQDGKIDADKSNDKKEVEKLLTCKHCNLKFARWRGFKLHVQVTHLKRLAYLCPYCDRSTNSELTLRQHLRAKHRGLAEKIVKNPDAGGPELTNEFWAKEYGLIRPNKNASRKRKRKSGGEDLKKSKDALDGPVPRDLCSLCGFAALNLCGLKAHMRMHANKSTLKCGYCAFSGAVDNDIWQHWKVNHPHSAFKVEELSAAGPSSQNQTPKQPKIEEYSDDIEEEQVPSATSEMDKLVYCCFYCKLRSCSLETVRTHWEMVHKEVRGPNDSVSWKFDSPFRYKEINVSPTPPQKILQCGYCNKQAGKATLRVHMRRKHSEVPPLFIELPEPAVDGWICEWCHEFCETETKKQHHQNMFHSHLEYKFRKLETEVEQKGFNCPECPFSAATLAIIKKHVAKHVKLFKCKYCDATFTTPTLVASHSSQMHPGSELKIESITNYEALVENLMAKVMANNAQQYIKTETVTEDAQVVSPSKRNAVAKKSTARQPLWGVPSPSKMRCVARKSTNSLSRYPKGVRFGMDEQSGTTSSSPYTGFSYYGVPSVPVSLASLSTYMSVGGHQMKVNCTTLGQLMNINPRVMVKDLKQDVKHSSVFSNRT